MEASSYTNQELIYPYYVKAIHPDLIQLWHLHPSSRGQCKDRCGVKQSVRYHKGHFQIKIGAHLRNDRKFVIPDHGWVPVVPIGGEVSREQLVDAYGLEYVEYQESISSKPLDSPVELVVNNPRVLEASHAGFSEMNRVMGEIVAQNQTGNHRRNKKIRIPTRPGEPVRA